VTVSTLTVVPEAPASGTAPCAEPTDTITTAAVTAPGFYLGTHLPNWLGLPVPLFVSDRRLRRYRRTLPRATAPWALDSGGFTELARYGTWDHGPAPHVYADRVRRYRSQIGHLDWAAPQDWMCEPAILAATGLTVAGHIARTVANYLQLRAFAPDLPFIPVVQGWTPADYLHCVDQYQAAGVDLTGAELVGVGSVCRRQATGIVGEILTGLHLAGVTRLHGFGVKIQGLARWGHLLTSADSLAWSRHARRRPPLPGCPHRSCANCLRYALIWRGHVLSAAAATSTQPHLFPLGRWSA
jgi:hypothetical protein